MRDIGGERYSAQDTSRALGRDARTTSVEIIIIEVYSRSVRSKLIHMSSPACSVLARDVTKFL